MYDGSLEFSCKNELEDAERIHRVISRFCELHGVPPRAIFALNLVADELLTNTIRHGFDTPGGHTLQLAIFLKGGMLTLVLVDDGRPFDPSSMPPPDTTECIGERPLGGLGVHLVRRLMNSINYRREGDKNILTLTKRIR